MHIKIIFPEIKNISSAKQYTKIGMYTNIILCVVIIVFSIVETKEYLIYENYGIYDLMFFVFGLSAMCITTFGFIEKSISTIMLVYGFYSVVFIQISLTLTIWVLIIYIPILVSFNNALRASFYTYRHRQSRDDA